MKRRTFVLLAGTASAALWRPPGARPAARGRAAVGTLRFDLDEQRRWSLSYHGDGPPVPLVRQAPIGVWVGDTLVTLADLQDITVANRRPPGGESLAIRGRATSGVWIEAEFTAWEPTDGVGTPSAHGSIAVSVYPDRVLATVRGIRFLTVAEADVLPGPGTLLALIHGYESSSPSAVVAAATAERVSHAALGLTRDGRGLAVAFEAVDPGDGTVRLARGILDAVSEWAPARPVRPEGDTGTLRIAYAPTGDGLGALGALTTPASTVDRERLASVAAPAGWSSGSALGSAVTEAAVLANLEACAARFGQRFLRYIQIDDGFQRALGDWDANAAFPNGHRWLTHRIHARGFLAGLWLAPFAAAERSGLPSEHPEWLGLGRDGEPLPVATRDAWGGRVYVLDGAHPQVQAWLRDLGRRVVRDWGYDYVVLDLLHWATSPAKHYGGLTHAEAYRQGLTALRDGLGTETSVAGRDAPLQHSVGLVTGMRIGPDVEPTWAGIQPAARAAGLRSFYHRAAWLNDPGPLVARTPLTVEEARAWASVVAISGGVTFLSDDLPSLPADRIPLLQRALPVSPVVGRAVATQTEDRDIAPAITSGGAVIPLPGPWRFRTGDDARYAAPGYDDESWETMPVPTAWEGAGHADYDGVAWYRTRFALPREPAAGGAILDLGKVDDADETFVNGVAVGGTVGRSAYRRYTLPAGALRWGDHNVLAVRVADAAGPGGLWRVERDRPAAAWVAAGTARWWTVVLVNWEDEPVTLAYAPAALGIVTPLPRLTAYDVWAEQPLPDVQQVLRAALGARGSLTVALRAAAPHPQVIGTTRHVVQGAVDVNDEQWDGASRTLSAKAVNLDGRRYAVTVAVPRGLRPGSCRSDVACTVRRLATGHAVLAWPAGTTRDLSWTLSFVPAPAPSARPGGGD